MTRGLWRWFTGGRRAGSTTLGGRGEAAAERLLRRSGYRILARNLRSRFGEIDLLAQPRGERTIAVVEVKTMRAETPAPEQHVNRAKRAKLTALAGQVARKYGFEDRPIRFDVVGVVWPDDASEPTRITHHVGAFEASF
jgi:putative endonuclease